MARERNALFLKEPNKGQFSLIKRAYLCYNNKNNYTRMEDRAKKEEELKKALAHCVLLSSEDKRFWEENASNLPDQVLLNVINAVKKKNEMVDQYLEAALEKDSEHMYLKNLKAMIQKIQEEAFQMEEAGEKETLEETLKKQLEDL